MRTQLVNTPMSFNMEHFSTKGKSIINVVAMDIRQMNIQITRNPYSRS
jgi:hypothetical protein